MAAPPATLHRHAPAQAIVLWCFAALLFTSQGAILKWLSDHYHFSEILFFRSVVVVAVLTIFLVRGPGLGAPFRTRQAKLHVARFLCFFVALTCFIEAVKQISLSDAIAVTFAAPLMMTALAVPLLGERIGPRRWTAVIVGLGGVLVIGNPSTGIFEVAALWALGSALGYALAIIVTRKLTGTDPTVVIVWTLNALYLVTMPFFIPFTWVVPTWPHLALMAVGGLVVLVAQLVAVHACRLAPPQVLAPFDYTAMIWAILLDLIIWHVLPSLTVIGGAAILIACGIYILYREAKVSRSKAHDTTGGS
ncbi:MAG: DMT family transporter [Pseudomonadota bacterium]